MKEVVEKMAIVGRGTAQIPSFAITVDHISARVSQMKLTLFFGLFSAEVFVGLGPS